MLNISTHSFGASLGRKQNFVLMFKVNFLGLGLLSFFSFTHTHTHTQLKTQCIFNSCNEFSANDS